MGTFVQEMLTKKHNIMKVLIVDNQELVFLSLEKTLKRQGYEVTVARNVYSVIETLESFKADMIIIDSNIPHSNELGMKINTGCNEKTEGLNLINYIRVIKGDFTPIILLSSNYNEDIIARGFALGVNDYMQKPLNLNEVCIRMKKLISNAIYKKTFPSAISIINSEEKTNSIYTIKKDNNMVSVA